MQGNTHPLFEKTETYLENERLQQLENERLNAELELELKKLDQRIRADLSDISREIKDEISLLNEVTGRYIQGIPTFNVV